MVGMKIMVCQARSEIAVGARSWKVTDFKEKNEFCASKFFISAYNLCKRRFLILKAIVLSDCRTKSKRCPPSSVKSNDDQILK
jgi:hypothetical protein